MALKKTKGKPSPLFFYDIITVETLVAVII